jgi:membrane-associated phospholipid phosphatase
MDSTPAAGAAPRLMATAPLLLRRDRSWGPVAVSLGVALLAAICVAVVDIPLAKFFRDHELPDVLHKFFEAAEHFGTFYGEALILLLLFAVHPDQRRSLVRLAAAAWAGGLAANIVKLCVPRVRPKFFDFDQVTSGHGFLGLSEIGVKGSRFQSFPSAHTATAVAFAVALSRLYPRGRWVFFLTAALVGLQRMDSHSHFTSDVIAGGLVGWLVATPFSNGSRLSCAFDRYEAGTR